jgi:Flp pilus assembly protein TadG
MGKLREIIRTSLTRRLARDRRGNVAITFALVGVLLILLVFAGVDLSNAFAARNSLQDATDSAALAVATEVSRNPNEGKGQLKQIAKGMLAANFHQGNLTLTDFHVCSGNGNDCTDGSGQKMQMNTVTLQTTADAPCLLFGLSPLCGAQGALIPVKAATTTTINFGVTLQLNIVMDSSASMIVGATQTDVNTIANWTANNWSLVKPGDPPPYTNSDNPPCAFACHDVGGATTNADIALGLTHAHAAGATTRFDVMITAAKSLINHLSAEAASSSRVPQDSFVFNVMSFDTALHSYGTANTDFAGALTAIDQVSPSLDTWLSTAMGQLVTQVGANGNGTSTSSPLKFLILVTDGLQSDRGANWSCSNWALDPAWGNYNTCYGGFATTINTAQCAQLKSNGVIVAVLETPYVPLTGQSPNVAPYEKTVRHVIFPAGPGGASTVSTALQTCASAGYYFQAANAADIATGFTTLTDKFIGDTTRIAN